MGIHDPRGKLIKSRGYQKDTYGRQYDIYLSNFKVSAKYLADRIGDKNKIIAELCCSIGATTLELAKKFKKVIAVDIDKKALWSCELNLRKENLTEKVELIRGDVEDDKLLKNIKADIVIYDIPYWVPKVLKTGEINMNKNPNLLNLIRKIRKYITKDIIIFAPPITNYEKVRNQLGLCEFEQIYINGRYDRNYIYLGNLLREKGITLKNLYLES